MNRPPLSIASVEGEVFTAQVVAQIQGVGERQLLRSLSQELEKRHRLLRGVQELQVGRQRLARYRFAHALFQQYLYNDLAPAERRLLHGQIATILENIYEGAEQEVAAQLAYHFAQAGDDQAALKYHLLAAEAALALYAHQEAESHSRRGLALEPAVAQKARFLATLGRALSSQGRSPEAIEICREGIACYQAMGSEGVDGVARLYAEWAQVAVWMGGTAARVKVSKEGLAAVTGAPDSRGLVRLLVQATRAHGLSTVPEKARPYAEQALAMAERLGAMDLKASAQMLFGVLHDQPTEQKRGFLMRAMELAESSGQLSVKAAALTELAKISDTQTSITCARSGIELYRQCGLPLPAHFHLTNVVLRLNELGELRQAKAALEEMCQLQDEIGDLPWYNRQVYQNAQAWFLVYRGEWSRAAEACRKGRAEARLREDLQVLWFNSALLAASLLESRSMEMGAGTDGEETEGATRECLEIAGRMSLRSFRLPAHCDHCWLYALQGRFDEARSHLEQARALDNADNPIWETETCLAEARLAAAQACWPEALSLYEKVHQRFHALGLRWFEARIRIDWAEALAGRDGPGDGDRARQLLQEALSMFQEMDAPGYVTAVERRLESRVP